MFFQKNIQSNIWKLYALRWIRWFGLFLPIMVLFFQENGLSMKEIILLQSIFSIAIILFEIPSGYFSDRLWRKKSIVIGTFLTAIGFIVYAFSYSFSWFLVAELFLGFGSSFISGTDSAMIYDTLLTAKKEKEYKKIEGKIAAIGNFSEAAASFIGGFLAVISLRTPYYFEIFFGLIAIFIAFTLIEPPRKKMEAHKNPIKEILKIVHYCLHKHAEVKWLIFYGGFIGASTLTMVWLTQPYFSLVGVPIMYFGILWGVLNISVGIFSLFAHRFEEFFGRKKSLISLIFIIFSGFMLVGIFQKWWAIIFLFLFYFVRGIVGPVLKDYINKIISSDMRATVLSVEWLVMRLIFSIVGPFAGWMVDVYTLQVALIASGCFFFFSGVTTLLFLYKHKVL